MATQEDKTGMLQRINVWIPCQNVEWKRITRSYSIAGHRALFASTLPLGFSITFSGRIPQPQAGEGPCIETISPSPPPAGKSHDARTLSGLQLYPRSLALCLAYNRCSINTCQMTECILSVSGCHPGPEGARAWEENVWTPAMPYISSIFSEP
ncbi:Hypothetical predicted protein [Lynx pardinus]|uniref:Uncharacterized protein n=1 Tax=Lynx pardinus TaxID=191816 RepID=A0A485MP33_LYNPA|nr:Hypothetical predicted protein [Lynx pardinus]